MCVVNSKESERNHSMGSLMDGAPPGPKTDNGRDHLIKDNLSPLPVRPEASPGERVKQAIRDKVRLAQHTVLEQLQHLLHGTVKVIVAGLVVQPVCLQLQLGSEEAGNLPPMQRVSTLLSLSGTNGKQSSTNVLSGFGGAFYTMYVHMYVLYIYVYSA